MAKNDDSKTPDADADKTEVEATTQATEPKPGLFAKLVTPLLGNRRLLIMAGGGVLVLLLVLVGASYFVFFAGTGSMQVAAMDGALPPTPPDVIFYDVPDIIVNIQSADSNPAYLKLAVALELDSPEEKAGIVALQPRIVDLFQGYLRELRADDLKGSAGVVRLKEELLRRINFAAAPYRVRDVLLKQMIVQ